MNEMIDLTPFCSRDETRLDAIGRPFTIGEFTYATDGRVLVEVAKRNDVPVNPKAPKNLLTIMAQWHDDGDWGDIPTALPASEVECDMCDEGVVLNCSCPNCDGHECEHCEGTGMRINVEAIPIGARWVSSYFLNKLVALPGVKVSYGGEKLSPMSVKFDGGRALLMPMRTE